MVCWLGAAGGVPTYETLIQYFPVRHGGADHHEKIDAGSWVNRHQSFPSAERVVWFCNKRGKAEQCIK